MIEFSILDCQIYKKENTIQLLLSSSSDDAMFQTCSKSHFDFFLLLFCDFVSLFFCLSSSCLFYSPTVNVQLHTTWADNKGVFQWKTHSFPLDSSRHLFNTEQHVSTAPFQSLVLWREKLAKNRRGRLKSRDFGTPSFWMVFIEAMRWAAPPTHPNINLGILFDFMFNMEFIKDWLSEKCWYAH